MKKPSEPDFSAKIFFKSFRRVYSQFLKYQLLTKILFSVAIMPLFWLIVQLLIASKHGGLLTNSTLMRFLLSPQGVILVVMIIGLIFLGVVMEICGFVIISSRSLHKQPEVSYSELIKFTLSLLPKLISVGSSVLLVYIIILGPISGESMTISFLDWLKVPNFISHVIFSNQTYLLIYLIIAAIALICSSLWVFSFHFLTIYNMKAHQAMAASSRLVKKNFWTFVKFNLKVFVVLVPMIFLAVIVWFGAIAILISSLNLDILWQRSVAVGLLLAQQIGLVLATMIAVPMQVHLLSMIFYRLVAKQPEFNEQTFPQIKPKTKLSPLDRVLKRKKLVFAATTAVLITASVPLAMSFDYFFKRDHAPEVIGHRGAGEEANENSLSGIKKAIEVGAQWSEIDIQRTSDGHYVLSHDQTFRRVAGDDRRAHDLTLNEVKQLNLNWQNPDAKPEAIADLEQVIIAAKNKLGLLIELKGKTADQQMIDNVAAMLKKHNSLDQAIIITSKYSLVQYSKQHYPHLKTGLIYFLGLGSVQNLVADYLIVEEGVASSDNFLNKAASAGKKVFVWTVNDEDSLNLFSKKPVAGIITDHPTEAREIINQRQNQTRKDILLEAFFSGS